MATKKEIFLDKFRCKGCGACEEIAPGAFKMDESEKADYIEGSEVPDELIEQAAIICPTKCIEIDETQE